MKAYFIYTATLLIMLILAVALGACSSQPYYKNGHYHSVGEKQPTKGCIDRGDCKVVNVADDWHMTNEEMQALADHIVHTAPMPACAWNGNCPVRQGSFDSLGGN